MPPKRVCDVLVLKTLLAHGPLTAQQIAAKGGFQRSVVNEGLRNLRAAKRVYVCGFQDTGVQGRERPIYAVGNLPDAVFVPGTNAEYRARYVARHSEEVKMRDRKRRNGWNKPLAMCKP